MSAAAIIIKGLCGVVVIASVCLHAAAADIPAGVDPESPSLDDPTAAHAIATPAAATHHLKLAYFGGESTSREARQLADWVADSDDNRHLPFAIVDKKEAKVFVFGADGQLRGAAPVLLGLAIGDDSAPGIGTRPLSRIRPYERTTPAGRFVASLDRDLHGEEMLWVDYDTAISMHPVVTTNPKEHRLRRLATATPLDNRISYGCINVPVKFFKDVVSRVFEGTGGIVYVLPETRSASEVFGFHGV